MIERRWSILCGGEKIGSQRIEDIDNPWHQKVPITPTMVIHLNQVVTQRVLIPVKTKLLQELQGLLYESRKNRREHWFDVYMTIFILLNNIEKQLAHSYIFAKNFAATGRYTTPSLAEGYFHAATTFLAFFHYCCQGAHPFDLDWFSWTADQLAILDAEQRRHMRDMKRRISEQQEFMLGLRSRHEYESDLYWSHQMFYPNWRPGPLHIEERP